MERTEQKCSGIIVTNICWAFTHSKYHNWGIIHAFSYFIYPLKKVLLSSPFYRWGNGFREVWSLAQGQAETRVHNYWITVYAGNKRGGRKGWKWVFSTLANGILAQSFGDLVPWPLFFELVWIYTYRLTSVVRGQWSAPSGECAKQVATSRAAINHPVICVHSHSLPSFCFGHLSCTF